MTEITSDIYDELKERFELVRIRVSSLAENSIENALFRDYVKKEAEFICLVLSVHDKIISGSYYDLTEEETAELNRQLYSDISGEAYSGSYANPDVCCSCFGTGRGRILAALAAELRNLIVYVFENRQWDIVITIELFLEFVYAFESEEDASESVLRKILYSHFYDYCPELTMRRVAEITEPSCGIITDIVMNSDLNDTAYLYRYGEYVSDTQIRTARFIASLSEDDIEKTASACVDGYIEGFRAAKKDITKKKSVNIRFDMGFERIAAATIKKFRNAGLDPVIYRSPSGMLNRRFVHTGFYGGIASEQYDYDHMNDLMLILDEKLVSRRLACLNEAFEAHRDAALAHGGPAVIETFGEKEFIPVQKESVFSPDEALKDLKCRFDSQAALLTDRYIPGSERSFTIIAFPIPDIGGNFKEIFKETVRINTMDSKRYKELQQKIIDVLDTAKSVWIKGSGKNETDLTVMLHELEDPDNQTNFENCTADVNIPVGEVFTSPVLKGTSGILHVSRVYINGLSFSDLKIMITDGMITDYSCEGDEGDRKGKKYIEDNILFGHKSLPLGEFAIGTNTEAYAFGRRYGIESKLPILIAEKTGPHFAFGDTCYSFEEDLKVYNPDRKEIIARENELSAKRKDDPASAYFNCHTDITIPYEELEYIKAVDSEGGMISIIENGRYVIKGTEELNDPLEKIESFVK